MKNTSKLKAILLSCASIISLTLHASVKETEKERDGESPYALVNYHHELNSLSSKMKYRLPIEEMIGACSHRYKSTFKNFTQFDRNLVRSFTNEYFSFLDKSNTNILTRHFDSLVPLINKFKSYVELLPDLSSSFSDAREDILGDIEFALRTRRLTGKPLVTIPFYLDVHARLVASLSTPSEDEKSIFWHAVNPEYLLGLYKNDAWKTLLKPFFETRDFDNKGQEVEVRIQSQYISRQVIDHISDAMNDWLYPNIHYPMYGEEKLGIPFLTYLALKRIYPFAYSHAPKGGAHGLKKISPAGMSAHDFVHSELDARTSYLKKNIVESVDRLYIDSLVSGSPVSAPDLASLYAPMAIHRLLRIEGALEWFFEKLMSEVLPQRGLSEFKKIMGGFFWVMRESIGFNSELYNKHGLTDVLDSFVKTALAKLNDPEHSWEVSSNPLETNPFDGTSVYSDLEIIERIKKEHQLDKNYGAIKSAKVLYSPGVEFAPLTPQYRFIDVVFEFMNGHEMTFSFPTMYHRLTNIEDARNLLLWAGTAIPKIKGLVGLSNEESNLRVAEYVDRIRQSLVEHIKYFKSVFNFFLLDERGGSPSLDQEYVRWTLNQEKKLRNSLKQRSKKESSPVFQEKHGIEEISQEIAALQTVRFALEKERMDILTKKLEKETSTLFAGFQELAEAREKTEKEHEEKFKYEENLLKIEHSDFKEKLQKEYDQLKKVEGWNSERFEEHCERLRRIDSDFWENSLKRREEFRENLNKTLAEEEELIKKRQLEYNERLGEEFEKDNSEIEHKIRDIDESIESLQSNMLKNINSY